MHALGLLQDPATSAPHSIQCGNMQMLECTYIAVKQVKLPLAELTLPTAASYESDQEPQRLFDLEGPSTANQGTRNLRMVACLICLVCPYQHAGSVLTAFQPDQAWHYTVWQRTKATILQYWSSSAPP